MHHWYALSQHQLEAGLQRLSSAGAAVQAKEPSSYHSGLCTFESHRMQLHSRKRGSATQGMVHLPQRHVRFRSHGMQLHRRSLLCLEIVQTCGP